MCLHVLSIAVMKPLPKAIKGGEKCIGLPCLHPGLAIRKVRAGSEGKGLMRRQGRTAAYCLPLTACSACSHTAPRTTSKGSAAHSGLDLFINHQSRTRPIDLPMGKPDMEAFSQLCGVPSSQMPLTCLKPGFEKANRQTDKNRTYNQYHKTNGEGRGGVDLQPLFSARTFGKE